MSLYRNVVDKKSGNYDGGNIYYVFTTFTNIM